MNATPSIESVPARFWRRLEDGRVECGLCPRACRLREGQRGFCQARVRVGDGLVLQGYGWSSGFCIDPIEKKPLYHFLPGTRALSFGTAGCNLACRFCQNWGLSHDRDLGALQVLAEPAAIARAALERGCHSVAFTYNEPAIAHEFVVDTAQACRNLGLRAVAVSSGYVCEAPRREFYRHMDGANIDLKALSDPFYRRLCGGRLQPVLETLLHLRHETRTWLEVTTLLIPGENDSVPELEALTQWFMAHLGPDVPLHFSAFHPAGRMPDTPPTPAATLLEARRIARGNGLRHVYVGNLRSREGAATWCHGCGRLLIGREGFTLAAWHLAPDGRCPACGAVCPGVFATPQPAFDGGPSPG